MNDGAPVPLDAKRQLAARLLRARQAIASAFPLSSGQRALLFLHEIEPEGSAYNVAFPIRLRGSLDLEALRRALQDVGHRHPMLRATFARHDGEPEQRITERAIPLQHVDLIGASEAELLSAVQAAYRKPFDLARDPVFRAVVLSVGPADHVLLPLAHHIVIDGQSILTILEDLGQAYAARAVGGEPAWPPQLHTYADFVRGQQAMLEAPDGERLWRFWQERLDGELPTLALPADRPPPPRRTENGGQVDFRFDADLLGQLKHAAHRDRVTLNALLLSAYSILLHRLSGQDDVLIGSIVSGRTRSEFDTVVGYFINTVVHRSRIEGDPSAAQVMATTAGLSAAAFAHQDFPFLQVVERLRIERNPAQTPVFQAAFNYRQLRDQQALDGLIVHAPGAKPTLWGGLPAEPFSFAQQLGQFDLALELFEAHGALLGNLKFNTDLFDRTTAERWIGHYCALLEAIAADASRPVRRLPMVSPTEQQAVQAWGHGIVAPYADGACVQAGFAAQARRHPDAPALIYAGGSISYDALDRRANRLARRLMTQGVTPGSFVGVMVERSPELVIAILAVLKAGGVYVPLDQQMPAPRRAFILGDTSARLLLTEREVAEADGDGDDSNPGIVSNPHDLAYVIYTSGSTGTPKGVAVTHANILSLTSDPYWHAAGHETVLLYSTPAFDASTFELWIPLLHGHTIALAQPGQLSTAQLADAIATLRPTRGFITPALFALMVEERPDCFAGMREIIAGGDVVPPDSVRRVLDASQVTVSNGYGPTEATTFTTRHPIERAADVGPTVPLGKPIANRDCLVLDDRLEPVPVGVIGELYIAGAGLARGYLNRPALTAERFIAHPLGAPGERLYRTGDRARWTADGILEFLGRTDDQVKVRGFRVEPGEIEGALRRHPAIAMAAVVAHDTASGKQLIAYLVIRDGEQMPTVAALRDHLGEALPAYMIPTAFMRLDALALGRTGKIDRKSLPAPEPGASGNLYRAPRNPTEELLAGIWAELLGQPQVGIDDNFFELGGHSLLATRLVSRLRTLLRREVPLRRLFERPTIASLVASLDGEEMAAVPPVIPSRPATLPPSFAQSRLWFLDQFDASSAAYVIPIVLELEGPLDAAALEQALQSLVSRHETLRTCFRLGEDGLAQEIQPASAFRLHRSDGPVETAVAALSHHRFDLAHDLPLHATLIRVAAERHVLAMVVHHIAFDGWSGGIFFGELAALYAAARRGTPAALPPLPLGYADFALWHQALMADPAGPLAAELAFWRTALDGAPARLELPTDLPRPAEPKRPAGFVPIRYSPEMLARWEALARRQGVTLFMVLHAAFAQVLSRWSGERDISIGTPIANRTRREFEGLIGFFVNTLVLRLRLDGASTLGALFERVREVDLAAFAHQALPFEKLVEELQPERVLGVSPLFQAMLAFQNAGSFETPDLDDLQTLLLPPASGRAKFALTLQLQPVAEGGLTGVLEYDAEMFSAASMQRMAGHLATLLEAMSGATADTPVDRLSMLTAAERQTLLHDWNATVVPLPQEVTLVDLFEEAARLHSEHDAVLFEDQRLSYAELHARANRLARYLLRRGIGHQARIGIALPRTHEMMVAILGVMKAGAAYVPLDPAYPAERVTFMVQDAGLALVLTDAVGSDLPAETPILRLDLERAAIDAESDAPPRVRIDPFDLIYVIYTSGSTGLPKGVAVPHRGLVNMARAGASTVGRRPLSAFFASSSINFDLSVFEMFVALASGESIEIGRDLLAAGDRIDGGLRALCGVPSVLRTMLETSAPPPTVDTVVLAGEEFPHALLRRLNEALPACVAWNIYGPTEYSCYCTIWSSGGSPDLPPTIGTPIDNTRILILDDRLDLLPVGIVGELYVAGEGMARGYLNRPGLTAERFIAHPLGAPGERLYRTGDRARWKADGTIEFLGRADYQVKVRGFRIEPGEIESTLRRHPAIAAAAVAAHDGPSGKQLVAYLVVRDGDQMPSIATLREHLAETLPSYMIPSVFMRLDALPLGRTGKLDRKSLPAPEASANDAGYRAPRTPTEELLAGVWAELLDLPRVGIDDNFFELGGHSLLATRLVSRLRTLLRREIPLRRLFERPTIAALAASLEDEPPSAAPLVVPPRPAVLPLSFAQSRLWFLEQLEERATAYLVPVAIELDGAIDGAALAGALRRLVARHEPLRTRFILHDGLPRQNIGSADDFVLHHDDLSGLAPDARDAALQAILAALAHHRFDLAYDLPLHATLIPLTPDRHVLAMVVHHIAFDGWSVGIFFSELAALYAAALHNISAALPPLPLGYADFALWHQALMADPAGPHAAELAFWRETLDGAPAQLELPTDLPRPAEPRRPAGFVPIRYSAETLARWETLARRQGVTLFMVLHAAFALVLSRWSGEQDVSIGTPIANRTRREFEGLIGFFVNTLVLRLRLDGAPTLGELFERVREVDLAAFAHQALPFEKLVEELQPERVLGVSPLFQAMLAFQNASSVKLPDFDGLPTRMLPPQPGIAKFAITFSLQVAIEGGLEGILEYDAEMFSAASMQRMAGHLETLLEAMSNATADMPVDRLSMLTAAERQTVLHDWNATAVPLPQEVTLVDLLEEAERLYPEHDAVLFEDQRLSYAELHASANRLAHHLLARGIGHQALIGVALPRSPELIVAILGVMKAGATYVPLDPTYPAERLAFMRRDADLAMVIDDIRAVHRPTHEPNHPPRVVIDPLDLAYVVYTSGSTGQPKGVATHHRGIVNLAGAQVAAFDIKPGDRILQFASPSFDASLSEIATALIQGAALIVASTDDLMPGPPLAALATRHRFSHVTLPPTALAVMDPQSLPDCRVLVVAGEACPGEIVAAWSPGRTFLNAYGPSEVTICASISAPLRDNGSPPIGAPIANTQVWLLDDRLEPVPIGVAGDLCVSGIGLARGYLNQPGQTAQSFIAHPFGAPGERLYRTGDRARWQADGVLEFLGRADRQVKVRGFRIEPGEIESALRRHPDISEAAVVPQTHGPGMRLVAYLVPRDSGAMPSVAALRDHLGASLPSYMVPALFVPIDALPLTPSGKVDRNALPTPTAIGGESGYRAPRTPCETLFAELWAKLLGRDQVGLDDNFFELGGDSIVSIQMIAQARLGGWIVTPRQVFQNPTIAALTTVAKPVADGEAPVDGAETGRFAPTPIMQWLFERGEAIDTFSQHLLLSAPAGLATSQLNVLLQALLDRHAALRMVLVRDPVDRTLQLDVPPVGTLQAAMLTRRCDISGLADEDRRRVIVSQIDAAQRRLSPATGVLLQAIHFDAGADTNGLLSLVIHHLAIDGVSWRILQSDIVEAWRQISTSQQPSLPPVGTSFRHWAQLLAARAHEPDVETELPYWSRSLGPRGTEVRPTSAAVCELTLKLPTSTTAAVLRAPAAYGARVHELLLAAFARAASESRGGGPVALDVEGHGRSDEIVDGVDLARTVGWFTSLYPVTLDPGAAPESAALVDAIKRQLRTVPHDGLGFGLLRYLNRRTSVHLAARHQPEIAFNYLGRFATPVESEWAIVPWFGTDHAPALPPAHAIEVNAVTLDGPAGPELSATWSWAPDLVDETSVRAMANAWFGHLETLAQKAPARAAHSASVEALPLSPLQEGLLFRSLYDPQATDVYVVQLELEFDGPLDIERLSCSVQALLQRHPNLSVRFMHEGLPRPMQMIAPEAIMPWRVIELADADADGLAHCRDEELATRFDLAVPPLFRACLVRQSGRAVLILTAHHILLDGWSMPLLLRDLLALYAGDSEARRLPPVAPYRRYLDWLAHHDRTPALTAWRDALDGLEEPSMLAGPRLAPVGARDRIEVTIAEATTAQIIASMRSAGLTLSTLLQGTWAILLSSLTGRSDVVFGVTVAGRPPELRGANDMVGLLANTVPLRTRLLPAQSVRAFLAELQDRQAELTPHHHVGLGEIQQRAGLGELFDTLLLFENYPIGDAALPEVRGAKVTRVGGRDATHYPLTLVAMPGASLTLRLDYRPDLVTSARMREIAALLPELLQRLGDELDRPLGALALRWPDTKHVIELANATARPLADRLLVDTFAEQAARTPAAPALLCGEERLTYAELQARAHRVTRRLVEQGIGPGDIVAVELPRSAELVATLLGVLQSGAAYLPLDPGLPAERRAFMLADARPALVLGDGSPPIRKPGPPRRAAHPLDLAYTIYTSGSTGTPKGVAVTHKALANFLAAMREVCPLRDGDRLLATTSIGFDIAGLELFLPLLSGAAVVLATADEAQDPAAIARLVDRHGIGTMQATPTLWTLLAETVPHTLSKLDVLVGGEALQPALARTLQRHARRVVNLYGPTETTIWSTAMALATDTVAIGGPIANTTAHVLDDCLEPAPIGVAGDLYVGGAGLARGYLGRPGLTADRFVADPFGPPGSRLYRTGDRARWRTDGIIEFIGRADDQVKFRGVRIEPAEIEAALLQDAAIAAAVVIARDGSQGRQLVAYLVMRDGAPLPVIDSLRKRLARTLPDVMVPTAFVLLDALPRNRNGKLDRKALPAPVTSMTDEVRRAPRSPAEKALAALWAELLGQAEVGIDDNFFELGGDSIVSIRLVARARQAGFALTPRLVFENPTVSSLAAVAGAAAEPSAPRYEPAGDTFPLAPLQQGLLLHDLDERSADAYRMQVALRLDGAIDRTVLRQAWALVFGRHEALRIAIVQGDKGPMQTVRPDLRLPWDEIDWPGDVDAFLAEDRRRGFDLAQGPLLRMTLLHLAPDAHVLVLTNQHLLIDGWSLSVLIDELMTAWQALASGEALALPPARPYRDYIGWLGTRDNAASGAFWRQHLAGAPEPLRIELGAVANATGMATHAARLSTSLTDRLAAAARQHRVSQHTILQATWGLLLAHHAGADDVVFGSVFAGRPPELEGIERMVGLFINTLPARLRFTANDRLGDWLTRQQMEQAQRQDHGFAGLSTIRRWAGLPAGEELFETLLVFENQPMEKLADGSIPPGVALAPLPVEAHTHYKLALAIVPGENVELRFSFDRARFAPSDVAALADRFTVLLDAMCRADAPAPVHHLSMMTACERDLVLRDWNATAIALPQNATLVDLLEDVAREYPEREAVLFEDQRLTHAELHARANRLAHHLIAQGVGRGALVGISLPRSPELIVALLGVIKTGAAYLPLDPKYPAERLAFMKRDACLALVVDGLESVRRPATESDHPPAIPIDPLDLAYVIYTSGSTGRPKGTGIAHRSAVNLARAQAGLLGLDPGARVLQFASANFDSSVWEWLALTSGAALVMAPDQDLSPGAPLAALAARHRVTHATLPPTALAAMDPASLPDCRVLVVAGEACPTELVSAWSPGRIMLNGYGPTEMTVAVSLSAPLTGGPEPPPIGVPIANTQAWVLDDRLEPMPPGVAGELYASGAGLARGYLGRPDLTAERFIAHPFGAPGERLYRTGDRARWRSDGTLEFLGRADRQIKLRGFRIEPGEIEIALRRHPTLSAATVVARDVLSGKRLVAYVVTRHDTPMPSVATLREHLTATLPEHMVPAMFIGLPALPLTPNGKIDHKALPLPDSVETTAGYRPPRDAIEFALQQIWQDVLSLPSIGTAADFYELGGDSISALQVLARCHAAFDKKVRVRDILEGRTIERLAQAIRTGAPPQLGHLLTLQKGDERAPLFCLHGATGSVYYALALARHLPGRSVYGLQLPEHDAPFPASIVEQAAIYIAELRQVQPNGPYHLLGWSYGGFLAHEMACQLQAAGEDVATLVLIDPFHSADGNDTLSRQEAEEFLRQDDGQRDILPEQFDRLVAHYLHAGRLLNDFRPRRFAGRVVLFEALQSRSERTSFQWLRADTIESVSLDGDHDSIVLDPHAAAIARRLDTP